MFLTNPWLFFKNVRLRADPAAITVTPLVATLTQQRRLKATAKGITVTRRAAAMSRTRVILAGVASIDIAGAAKLKRNLLLKATPVALTASSSQAVMQRTRLAGFIKAEVSVAPQAAKLLLGRRLKAQAATLALQGKPANFLKVAGSVGAVSRAITIAPQSVELLASRLIALTRSEIIVAPKPALMLRRYPLLSSSRAVSMTPQQARLLLQRRLASVNAEVALAAQATELLYTPNPITFTVIATSQGNASTKLLPAGVHTGDLCVLYDSGVNASVAPSDVIPTGWTGFCRGVGTSARYLTGMAAKVLSAGEVSAGSVAGINGTAASRYSMVAFRPSRSISSFAVNSPQFVGTQSDPAALTTTSGSATSLPVLVLGLAYGDGAFTATETPNMTDVPSSSANFKPYYTLYDASPLNQTLDMPDTFDNNNMGLAYLTFS